MTAPCAPCDVDDARIGPPCPPHKWRIGEQHGPTSPAMCSRCGATSVAKNVYVLDREGEAALKTRSGANRALRQELTNMPRSFDAGTIRRVRGGKGKAGG